MFFHFFFFFLQDLGTKLKDQLSNTPKRVCVFKRNCCHQSEKKEEACLS